MTPMEMDKFESAFFAANGAYSLDTGGGDLTAQGYQSVPGGAWIDSATGFKARAYTDGNGNYILAFAGTESVQDGYQNLASLGWDQWEQNKPFIMAFFQNIKNIGQLNTVTFTGHSLGGALAQYAAYDFAGNSFGATPIIEPENVSIITFNGLGGVEGLKDEYGTFDDYRLATADIHNYFESSDLVVQLSEHIGGQSSNYKLTSNTETKLFYDAHVMSTIAAQMANGIIQINLQANHNYFDLGEILPLIQTIGSDGNGFIYGNEGDANSIESAARIISALAVIPLLEAMPLPSAIVDEYEALRDWVLDNLLETKLGITDPTDRALAVANLGTALSLFGARIALGALVVSVGAQATALVAEAFDLLVGDGQVDPANDLLMHSIFNKLSGAIPDEYGVYSNGTISDEEVLSILDSSGSSELDRYNNIIKPLAEMFGISVSNDLMGAINLHHHVLDQNIMFTAVIDGNSITQVELDSLLYENTTTSKLGRYSILNNVPFLLVGAFDESQIASGILNAEKYTANYYDEAYW